MSATKTSTEIILEALADHLDSTGDQQKKIAIEADLAPNYFSMLKKGDRIALPRIAALGRALPELDVHALTAAVFTEMFPDPEAHAVMVDLMKYLTAPPPFEQALLDVAKEVRDEDEQAGLVIPTVLHPSIRTKVKKLLKEAVQMETMNSAP